MKRLFVSEHPARNGNDKTEELQALFRRVRGITPEVRFCPERDPFPADPRIRAIRFTSLPYGEYENSVFAYLGVPDGAGYDIIYVRYKHYDNTDMPETMEESEVFAVGETYYLEVRLKAVSGYYFDENYEPTPMFGGSASEVDPTWAYVMDENTYIMFTVDFTVAAFTYGDVNGDGIVNKKDSLMLRKYLSDSTTPINLAAADVFPDGAVNKKDSLRLKQYLAGYTVTLGA